MGINKLLEECAALLKEHHLTLAFAESVTAGYLCHAFGALPQCGSFFKGGIIAYDASVKKDLLGLKQHTLDEFTPESAEVTRKMVLGLQHCIPADLLIATTGLNTPGGSESPDKPVGTIFTHYLYQNKEYTFKKIYQGSPEEINRGVLEDICLFIKKTLVADTPQTTFQDS